MLYHRNGKPYDIRGVYMEFVVYWLLYLTPFVEGGAVAEWSKALHL